MRNILFFILLLWHVSPILGQETPMKGPEITSFKDRVNETSKSTQTIQSDFVQYKHLDFLSNDIVTHGKMVFKSPNRVKWEYTKPFQYSIVFLEDKLLINDGGTKSDVDMGNSALFQKLNQLIVNSVKGDLFQDSDFDMEYFRNGDHYKVVFTPRDEKIKSYIATFILTFDKDQAAVQEVKMIEPSNDFTRIVFTNRILNQEVDNAVFSN